MDNEYLGKIIKVTNSPFYIGLQSKYDKLYETDCDLLNSQIISSSRILSNNICNKDKTEFLAIVSSLGSIDGGDITLHNVNSQLPENLRIDKIDIVEANLRKIFPNESEEFIKEIMKSISAIFSGKDFPTQESKVVYIAYVLELLAKYIGKNNNWDINQVTDYIFSESQKLKTQFKQTGSFDLDEKTKTFILSINNYNKVAAKQIDDVELKSIVDSYKFSNITKEEFINELYSYNSKKKVRGR